MDVALVFNKETGFSRQMTAVEFERLYRGNDQLGIVASAPAEEDQLQAVSPDDALPLTFRRSHKREGDTKIIPACWVRPPGFGDHDHVFNQRAQEGLPEALKKGKAVLLSLNLQLTAEPTMSFSGMKEKGSLNLQDWIGEHRGDYISIPVHSATEAQAVLLKIHQTAPDFPLRDRVFALHRDAVVSYRNFYLGHRDEDFAHLYNALQKRRAGVPIGTTRMVGFPRLFRLIPTETALEEQFSRGIKGNRVNQPHGKPLFSSLIFTHHDEALKSDPYKILTDELLAHRRDGVYVLASPSVTVGRNADDWKMMRWIINDIERQTAPVHHHAASPAAASASGNGEDEPAQHSPGM